jgi:hypothetical protein
MATFNLFLNASQVDSATTNAYRLFHPEGLTGQNLSLYGGNINHWGTINSTQLYITGDIGEESFINRLTGGIRVVGDCEFDRILNGVDILGTSYIQTLTGGLNVTNGGINVVGNSVNNGSFRNVGAVSVTGPTAITGATTIVGNTDIRGNFYQSGVFDVISSDGEFRGNLDVTGTLDVNGPLAVNGATTITSAGGLTISGPATVNGDSTLNGITNVVGELQLNGQPFFTQQLNETTEINYFLTGGECVSLIESNAGAVISTSNTGLIPRNQGPTITGTTRGSYAVDLQLSRTSMTQVAGGNYSALLGGKENKAVGVTSVSIGGSTNTASGSLSAVIGGSGNMASGSCSAAIGGSGNVVRFDNSAAIGGYSNIVGSEASVIGGSYNTASGNSSSVIGGAGNKISYGSTNCIILGGFDNTMLTNGDYWGAGAGDSVIIGGSENEINSPFAVRGATIIGGRFGKTFNNSERVLSNGYGNPYDNPYAGLLKTAQVGEVVLSLFDSPLGSSLRIAHGFFINGNQAANGNPVSGLYIPSNTIIAFKGFGTVDGSFVELKGTVSNNGFAVVQNSVLNNNTITGGVFSGENNWFLKLTNPTENLKGTLYLEMVYAPYSDIGTTNGPIAFNSNPDLDTLFS